MRHEVRVLIDERQEFTFELVGVEPMAPDVARQWLDEQFTQLECEPLRASGKLLLADKVLVVAQAGGAELLADPTWGQTFARAAGVALMQDPTWSRDFARAASAALAKPIVRVDVPGMAVTF